MERGIQEPDAVESLIDVANRDTTAEFEVKMLSGRIQTRDIAERLLRAIESVTVGEHVEEHRLTYSFKDGTRVHVKEPQHIHTVCTTQTFKVPLTVEKKKRYFESTSGRDIVDAPEVLTRFTLRSETHVKKDFAGDVNDPSAHIRILNRKAYTAEGGEFRIDFSMVKSKSEKQGLREVLKNLPSYELEIEYIPRSPPRKPAEVRASLYTILNTLLAAYLRSPAILLQSETQKYIQEFRYSGIRFYNVLPLERAHMVKSRPYNILKGYTVTNKADGDRAGLYVARDRRVLRVTNKGETIAWTGLVAVDDKHADDFLDGEYIEKLNLFCIFDVFRYKNKDVRGLPLFTTDEDIRENPGASRLGCAREFVQMLPTDFKTIVAGFKIETKLFLAGDGPAMEEAIHTLLDTEFKYETDGLIFTPRASPVAPQTDTRGATWLRVYKWKPPFENTIDFLLKFVGQDPEYEPNRKRMCRKATLYVSMTRGEYVIRPCETITGEYVPTKLPEDLSHLERGDRIPSVFQPSAPRDNEASTIWVPVNRKGVPYDLAENRIEDNTIVECSYNVDLGRWDIKRTRYDKTFEYRILHNPQFGNDIRTAEDTWKLIHAPISESMLRAVVSNPPDDTFEDDAYYRDEDMRGSVTVNLRGFHNRVKEYQYMQYVVPTNTLFELAVGRAGDLHKWIKTKASLVMGIDTSTGSFSLPKGGACVRYLNEKRKGTRNLPKALFAEGDMTKPFEEQASTYLSMVFGNEPATTPYIQLFKDVKMWDVMACQFAIHYACSDEETFKVFIANVKNHCASVLFGTCLDGKSVYSLLVGKDRYVLRSGGRMFAQIEKKYEAEEWTPEFGQTIDVTLESTERAQTEYLVPFERIVELFGEAGFDLLETKMFSDLYSSQTGISLDESQQEYSFLHRTFAFKRRPEVEEKVKEEEKEEEQKEEEKPKEDEEEEEEEEEEEKPAKTEKKIKLVQKESAPADIVFFFSKEPTNKEFSSFYESNFKIEDVVYKSAEHAYQGLKAKKFGDETHFAKIVKAKSAQSAKSFGKKVEKFDAEMWNESKEDVMRQVLRAKFSQNPPIRKLLLDTGDKLIANADPRDSYWGIGTSSGTSVAKNPSKWKGQNKLGKLLAELRDEFRAEDAEDEAAAEEEE